MNTPKTLRDAIRCARVDEKYHLDPTGVLENGILAFLEGVVCEAAQNADAKTLGELTNLMRRIKQQPAGMPDCEFT